MNHYFNPVKICQGKGCLAKLPDLLQSLVADKGSDVLLIVWSECVLEHEIIKDLLNKQDGYKVHPVVFTASNPSVQDLYGVYDHTRKLNLGAVVGIGGGSVLDVAKSLCCLHDLDISNIDELRTAIIDKRCTENRKRPNPPDRRILMPEPCLFPQSADNDKGLGSVPPKA